MCRSSKIVTESEEVGISWLISERPYGCVHANSCHQKNFVPHQLQAQNEIVDGSAL